MSTFPQDFKDIPKVESFNSKFYIPQMSLSPLQSKEIYKTQIFVCMFPLNKEKHNKFIV